VHDAKALLGTARKAGRLIETIAGFKKLADAKLYVRTDGARCMYSSEDEGKENAERMKGTA